MSKGLALVLGLLAGVAAAGTNAAAASWRVLPLERAPAVTWPLPPLAEVTRGADGEGTWRQTGRIGGSLATVRSEFAAGFSRGGWSFDKAIPLGKVTTTSEIMIWTRGSRRLLLMIWEQEAGTCGFAVGEE
jgi:hypothetical protein